MDPRKLLFLQAVVGADGARALAKAASEPDLAWAVTPRVVLAWLEAVSYEPYNDIVPGLESSRLVLKKTEAGYSGSIDIDGSPYTFKDASVNHVAGSVAVALGLDEDPVPALRHPVMAKLGKAIDLIVRARTLRKAQEKHAGAARGITLPGTTAKPQAPIAPLGPVNVQPKMTGAGVGTKAGTTAKPTAPKTSPGQAPSVPDASKPKATPAAAPKLPGTGVKKQTIKVTKSESLTPCPVCSQKQFQNDRYVACLCFRDLVKSTKTAVIEGGYILELGQGWGSEEICVLVDNLRKGKRYE